MIRSASIKFELAPSGASVWHNPPLIFQRSVTDGGIDRGNSSQKASQQTCSE